MCNKIRARKIAELKKICATADECEYARDVQQTLWSDKWNLEKNYLLSGLRKKYRNSLIYLEFDPFGGHL